MRKKLFLSASISFTVIPFVFLIFSCSFESSFVDLIQDKINTDLGIAGNVAATGITLDKSDITVTSGYTQQLTAVFEPANATNQVVNWSSNDGNKAAVSDTGLVTGTGPGSATITATTSDGEFSATCEFLVLPKGEIDTDFNTLGYVRQELKGQSLSQGGWNAVHFDTEGRILVTGWADTLMGGEMDMYSCRYNSNGSLDQTFNTDGIISSSGTDPVEGCDITTDGSNNILIAGKTGDGAGFVDLAIWRYLENGNTDSSFSMVNYEGDVTNDSDVANGIVIDDSGKIVVAGYTRPVSDDDILIQRYNDDGSENTSFDDDGTVTIDHGENDWGSAVTLDEENNIVVTGYIYSGAVRNLGVWRYKNDGTADSTFGTSGAVILGSAELGNTSNYGQDVIIDANGKILVTGYAYDGSNYYMILLRLNDDGSLDTSFGINGYLEYSYGYMFNYGYGLCLDNAGNILVTGRVDVDASHTGRIAIWRYLPDGTSDPTFGTDGAFVCDDGTSATGAGIATDSDGKIVVAGSSSDDLNIVYRFR